MSEEMEMIHKINKNLFGRLSGGIGLQQCNCGKLMEWHDNRWTCDCGVKHFPLTENPSGVKE